jgi:replication factor C small subunit
MESQFKSMGIWIHDKKPQSLSDMVGNAEICHLLSQYIEKNQVPNILFTGEHGVGKRTLANIFCKSYLQDDLSRGRLVIDGAISRGKDVVSDTIQEFARRRVTMGDKKKLILITNFDSMTHEAQNALRRIMELEISARFILTAHDASDIIEALQSRCTILLVKGLDYDESLTLIRKITSDSPVPDDIANIISLMCDGDMKRIINYCQTLSVPGSTVSLETFYKIFNIPPISHIEAMLTKIHKKESVFSDIDYLMDQGYNYNDILDIISRILAYRTGLIPDDARFKYLGLIAEHYCEVSANTVRLHMYSLFGKLC